MPALDSAHTQRAHEGCQLRLCGEESCERRGAARVEPTAQLLWLTCTREVEARRASVLFSTLTSSHAHAAMQPADRLKMLERRAQPPAAANTNTKMESCDEPLENNASSSHLLIHVPRKAAACRVICSAAGGPHRHSFPPSTVKNREITDELEKECRENHEVIFLGVHLQAAPSG